MSPRKYILDGDYGIDDTMALLYLAAEPEVEIVAVGSVHGNTDARRAALNASAVLALAGLHHVPVAVGAGRPLAQPLETSGEVHGDDGLGGAGHLLTGRGRDAVAAPAAVQLVEMVRRHPGECSVVATGPLTNLAVALLLDPGITDLVERVVVMGGTVEQPGNVGPYTEANIGHDPEAADLVFSAPWPVTQVGLDVTMTTWLEPADLERIRAAGSPGGRLVWAALQHYLDFYRNRHGRSGCPLHDPTAACLAVDPGLAGYLEAPVRVELRSVVNRGMLIIDRRPFAQPGPDQQSVRIATRVERDRVVARFLAGLLGEPLRPRP